ncbi:MAG TPA: hypothetical protein VMB53_06265 [Gaiellaceae bacterium]|nr:hypothetical protein [Gaiellaceae bacterium]
MAKRAVLSLRRRLAAAVSDAASTRARRALAREDRDRLARFARLAPELAERHRALAGAAPAATAPWSGYAAELERALLPVPPSDFLRLPVVAATMLPHSTRARRLQLEYLRGRRAGGELARLLREDAVGDPVLVRPYPTSANRVHVLAHVERFAEATRVEPASVASVVEWGGGYGALCRAWRLLGGATYTILDLPIASCLQWLFLASVLGEDAVVLHDAPGEPVLGLVNLMPADPSAPVSADVFVSTWALSESPPELQDAVAAGGFFGARHLLLAYRRDARDFPGSAHFDTVALHAGAQVEPVLGYRASTYAFR